eukprot:810891_1
MKKRKMQSIVSGFYGGECDLVNCFAYPCTFTAFNDGQLSCCMQYISNAMCCSGSALLMVPWVFELLLFGIASKLHDQCPACNMWSVMNVMLFYDQQCIFMVLNKWFQVLCYFYGIVKKYCFGYWNWVGGCECIENYNNGH